MNKYIKTSCLKSDYKSELAKGGTHRLLQDNVNIAEAVSIICNMFYLENQPEEEIKDYLKKYFEIKQKLAKSVGSFEGPDFYVDVYHCKFCGENTGTYWHAEKQVLHLIKHSSEIEKEDIEQLRLLYLANYLPNVAEKIQYGDLAEIK